MTHYRLLAAAATAIGCAIIAQSASAQGQEGQAESGISEPGVAGSDRNLGRDFGPEPEAFRAEEDQLSNLSAPLGAGEQELARFDADRNGRLDRSELERIPGVRAALVQSGGELGDFDVNQDGRLETNELRRVPGLSDLLSRATPGSSGDDLRREGASSAGFDDLRTRDDVFGSADRSPAPSARILERNPGAGAQVETGADTQAGSLGAQTQTGSAGAQTQTGSSLGGGGDVSAASPGSSGISGQ